jgi:hypothetical protein
MDGRRAWLLNARAELANFSLVGTWFGSINQWSAMKRLGAIAIGAVSMMAAGALVGFIHARYFDSPKLCIGVMAQMMAKQKDETPGMFMREIADLLDLKGVTDEKLNEAWEKETIERYTRKHSPAEAAQWMDDFRKQGNCI